MVSLLVVDDEPNILDALELILSDVGYQVDATTSSREALNMLNATEHHKPDLIISDIVMPEMSGLELFDNVRASTRLDKIPFLFISAFITPEIEELVATENRTAFLRKPFEIDDLLGTIDSLCSLN